MTGTVYWLHPGELVCAERGDRLETLLGSCIALLFTDRRRSIGAMCHVVHPHARVSPASPPTAHGNAAIDALRALLRSRGFQLERCDAWLAGGGNMFPDRCGDRPADGNVGAANVEWALATMGRLSINVVGMDLGGSRYRRLSWTVGDPAPDIVATELATQPATEPAGAAA